ncbi:MAG: hypothetical protein QM757_36245 [Paludibaculum sp.]
MAALAPGTMREYFLSDMHATSSGRDGSETASTRLEGVSEHNRRSSVMLTRNESGATLEFSAASPTPSSEECQQCIHMCAAQTFSPGAFELTEKYLANFGSVTKMLTLKLDPGDNGCTGSAKATLNAKVAVEEEIIFEPGSGYGSGGCRRRRRKT